MPQPPLPLPRRGCLWRFGESNNSNNNNNNNNSSNSSSISNRGHTERDPSP